MKKSLKEHRPADEPMDCLPHAIELEEAVLGTWMLDNTSLDRVEKLLSPDLFYLEPHRHICRAILELKSRDEPFDILTVTRELQRLGLLQKAGGAWNITRLTFRVTSSAHMLSHAAILFEKQLAREIILKAEEILRLARDESLDVFDLAEKAVHDFEQLNALTDSMEDADTKSAVELTVRDILHRLEQQDPGYYATGLKRLDEIIGISPNELLLIAGPAGAGKTRFVIALMDSLLASYPEISVHWFCFEDPKEKIIRCFAARNLMIREDKIRGKSERMDEYEISAFLRYASLFGNYDIVFVEETKTIRQVSDLFRSFCKSRPGRFNICIIDNLLLLEDDSPDRDDIIAKELNRMRKRTGGLIIPIHHYYDEQQSKDMLRYAYRPRLVHLKGRESYRRACTQILLLNKPGNYADLVAEYKGLEDILQHLFIIDIAKNRDGIANDDAETLIRLWADLDYLIFRDI